MSNFPTTGGPIGARVSVLELDTPAPHLFRGLAIAIAGSLVPWGVLAYTLF